MTTAHPSIVDALKQALGSFQRPIEEWTADQRQALEEYQATSFLCIRELDRGDKSIFYFGGGLDHLIQLFSRIFFCGRLRNVLYRPCTMLLDSENCYGQARKYGRPGEVAEVSILIDVEHPVRKNDTTLSQSVFGTLLHGCVHAYFMTAGCSGDPATTMCEDESCHEIW